MKMVWNAKSLGQETHSWTPCRSLNRWSENILPNEKYMSHQGIRQVENISNLFFWYNQGMSEIVLVESEK